MHANLMAHWTILAALLLFLDAERGRRLRWWALLIAVTTLIHSYLLVIVGAIWASSILVRFVEGSRQTRLVTLGHAAIVLALVTMLAWWLGVGDQMSTGGFGTFPMPLDALWNPGINKFSNLLPAHKHSLEHWLSRGTGPLVMVNALSDSACVDLRRRWYYFRYSPYFDCRCLLPSWRCLIRCGLRAACSGR
jgi:hypothetical protein